MKLSLNAFWLKIIALVSMTIDHIGYFGFPGNIYWRIVGRLSFVIFAYMIANGYLYTRNKVRHGLIILGLGLLFDLALIVTNNYSASNIFTTLGLGYFLIMFYDNKKYGLCSLILLSSLFFPLDYGIYGLLFILFSYIFYNNISKLLFANVMLVIFGLYFGMVMDIQIFSCLGIILLYCYNHEKGRGLKYFFYIYYPAHIIILRLIFS